MSPIFVWIFILKTMKLKKLLLVEDNQDDEILTRRAIEKYSGFGCIDVANDGVDALAYLSIDVGLSSHSSNIKNSHPLPDLILLDLKMPRLNGHEFIKHVRGNLATAHIPIIVLTTSSEQSDIALSYQLGANSFLRKPVNFLDFSKVIKQLSRYWLELNIPASQLSEVKLSL